MSNRVKVTVNGSERLVRAGTLLSDVLNVEKPCGGHGLCGKCRVLVNGREELACRYVIQSDIEVKLEAHGAILSETGVEESGRLTDRLSLCLDLGSTTLAMALVSIDERQAVRVITATNPQRAFGADVISRIEYCRKHSVKRLQEVLVEVINRMISLLGAEVETLYVSGNPTMLHTLFGVDCSSLGVAPYLPAFLEKKQALARELRIRGAKNVISLPSIASFVGADIVAGLYWLGWPKGEKYDLLVDLGTNAEVVLYSGRGGVATSAAAGPCFEGANVSCGMSATAGAISSFSLNYGHTSLKTVENAQAKGICGTGLIDVIAELLRNGIIDETGYLDEPYPICDGVLLTGEDVRQYQLAKSAVSAAILSLMRREGIGFDDIAHLYLSGGFSARIDLANAAIGGLLPRELVPVAESIGNSSLLGTVKYACEGGDLEGLTERISFVDLSSDPCFAELFVENMSFSDAFS